MSPSQRAALEAAKQLFKPGYARDITQDIIDGCATDQDADSLFRTAILDETWELGDASDLFYLCIEVMHPEKPARPDNQAANVLRHRWQR
jgi:hypothetical protein